MKTTFPPGPRGRLLPTVRFAYAPLPALTAWRARYGDPFTIHAINGDVVNTARPDLIKAIFSRDPNEYLPFAVDAIVPLVGRQSIFVQHGLTHRRQRRLLMPPFHGERMQLYADIIADATRRRCRAATGPVSMLSLAQDISVDVIVRAVFGAEQGQTRAIEQSIRALVAATNPILLFLPFLQLDLGGYGPFARLRRGVEAVDRHLQLQIDSARARGAGHDVLSLLLAARDDDGEPMADVEVKDHLRTILFAGHETTAIALAWAVDQLGRHPEILRALQEEIDRDRPSAWLSAVVDETLRMYPPVSEVLRALRSPMPLDRWTLPAGAVVSPNIYLLHRDPDLYPEPDLFRPQRFIDDRPKPDRFLPFGGGHRRCIGAAFAARELAVALKTLVTEYDVELLSSDTPTVVRRNVTLAPGDGVPVRLKPRVQAVKRRAASADRGAAMSTG